MKKMIFHYPNPLNYNATSASGIRPLRMIEAFKKIGYEVYIIDGYAKKRKKKIKKLKEKILAKEKFDFLYSESLTQPTLLSEKNHIPTLDFEDFKFFKFCKKNSIKIGLFYRDIYWAFSDYGKELSFFKKSIAKLFYYYDLYKYRRVVDILYLPSLNMAKYVPLIQNSKMKALPPAHNIYNALEYNLLKDDIELLYIGGVGEHYKMCKLFNVLNQTSNIKLTICTRKDEWEKVKSRYRVSSNIKVVHKSGKELEELYKSCDIATIFVKPQEYREFAMPVKLFEYIGYEKPILASKDTLVADFVSKNSIGWSVEYNEDRLKSFFNTLSSKDFKDKKESIREIKSLHTWEARAKEVKEELI